MQRQAYRYLCEFSYKSCFSDPRAPNGQQSINLSKHNGYAFRITATRLDTPKHGRYHFRFRSQHGTSPRVMFESLSDKLKRTLKNLRGEGVLTKEHVDAALREIRLALLEADVNYKVAKDFIAQSRRRPKASRSGRNSNRRSKSSRSFSTNWLNCSAANRHDSFLQNNYPTR